MTPPPFPLEHLLVVGALHVDDIATSQQVLVPRASNPVCRQQRVGGVGANAALAAARFARDNAQKLRQHIAFAGAIGTDPVAAQLEATLVEADIIPCLQRLSGCLSGRYIAVMDATGELYIGLSDVALAESLDATLVPWQTDTNDCQAVLMDANLAEQALAALSLQAGDAGIIQVAMSVSPAKSRRLLGIASSLDLLFCNRREAIALAEATFPIDAGIDQLADALLKRGFRQFVLTDATSPVVIHSGEQRQYVQVPAIDSARSVNGAGDALAGATFAAWCAGTELADAVRTVGLPYAERVVKGLHEAPILAM
ncbi:PfkB family carbohydrate kinase [Granulosicoccus antarcticus]|uniref:Pseudouridine kinase n=1 Tax=Granulosicoccus antarcticus IMCC3135 TaxID=1192854 RepID=A0A2Z2NK66_9GAMM|nr:PfkB family carbohydrate kinase [Granulosicoccus antarcticus]ASJ71523.1 Pseudouridine kinase [Granulosicoccus antarcticus IMCC3135]